MKLKTLEIDGKTYAEVSADGKPLYTGDDGKEIAFDAVATNTSLRTLRGEAQGHREAKEAAERALKAFEGIEDPAAARKALEELTKALAAAGRTREDVRYFPGAIDATKINEVSVPQLVRPF